LSPAFAVRIAMHVAEGLHAAHETRDEHGRLLEVVHRDVSPENILLAYAGHVKLIDFGIAKAYGRRHRTQEGLLKGKFRYMAPEQAYGKAIDRRTDLYQLAIVLWELLTLRRLFDAETDVALLQQVRDPKIVAPGTLVKGIPPALDATLMSALDPDPTRRPPDAQTFARMLGKALPAAREVDGGALSSLVVALMQEQRAREKRTLPPHVYERLERQLPTAQMGSNAEKPERAAAKHTLEHTSPYGSDVAAPGSVAPPAHGGTAPGYGTSPSHASRAVPGRSVRAAEESPRRRRLVRIASEIKTTITRIAEGEVSARRMFWLSALGAIGLGGALALLTLALRAPRSAPPPPPPAPVVAGMEAAHDAVDAAHPSSALAPFAPRDGGALDALAPEPTLSASADPTDAQRPAGTMRAQPAKLPAPVSVDGTPLVMQPGF
jgi:serine/threonine-protein kinase